MQLVHRLINLLRVKHPAEQAVVDMLALVIMTALVLVTAITLGLFLANLENFRNAFVAMITLMIAYTMLRAGYLAITKFIVVFGIAILSAILAITSYGIYAPVYLAPIISIMLASLLYSSEISLFVCIFVLGFGIYMVTGVESGFLNLPDTSFLPPWGMLGVESSIFIMVTVMSYFARYSRDRTLLEAQSYAARLQQRNRELDIEIGERVATNRALQISEQRYRTVVEDQPNLIARWTPDGKFTFVNGRYCKHFDKSEAELLKANLFDLSPAEVVARLKSKLNAMSPDNPILTSPYQFTNHGGEQIWQQWIDRGIFDENGVLIEIESIGTDITSQKMLEEKSIALQVSEEREAFMTEFMGTMTHDLKTPLSVMNTSLYLALNTPRSEKRKHYLEQVGDQIKIQERMINNILSVMRLNHLPETDYETLAINGIITELKERLWTKVLAGKLSFTLDLEADLPIFSGNAEQIERLLLNLIENAINYTPSQGSVKVRTHSDETTLTIEVEDSGIGIPGDDMDKIFSRFFRATNARDIQGGTGLGLAIVHRIVELHRGQIQVDSSPGKGSRFTVTFPRESAKSIQSD